MARTPTPVAADGETSRAAKNCRVSVVIPARDEEGTVGDVVRAVHRAWVEQVPLVDELVVIDSDSRDDTARVAADAGATVHAARDILPDLEPHAGKGEALWKSLHVTTGDVLVFLDADLVEWGVHFVSGLLAPLFADDGVHLVKAVYDRPHLGPDGREVETGGRVTELVARPLLALHHPELADVVQPLAGEWAVRRSAFETYAVPVGYGVEIAALVDTATRFGPDAIAQVDLGRRTHRHHRHDTLGPMAVQVMAAVRARSGASATTTSGPTTSWPTGSAVLTQYDRTEGGYRPRPREVDLTERPPAVGVPGYPAGPR